MSIRKLNPYLMFNGTAEQAIQLYESALGAKTDNISRFGEVPDMKVSAEQKQHVMHAMLQVGEGILMLSDSMPSRPVEVGSNVQVCLNFTDIEDMTKKFEALSVGGKVTYPIHDTFWGAKFGMLTEAFDIRWMFNCEAKQP